MTTALLIDFGSTFTKLRAVDLEGAELIGAGQGRRRWRRTSPKA